MNQEDKLRNALRDYYDTQHTPFEEQEWERASAYLRKARNTKKLRYLAPLLALLLSTGLVAYFYFPGPGPSGKQLLSSNLAQTPRSAVVPQAEVQQEKKENPGKNNTSQQLVQPKHATAKTPVIHPGVLQNASESPESIQATAEKIPEEPPVVIQDNPLVAAEIKITGTTQDLPKTTTLPGKAGEKENENASALSAATVALTDGVPTSAAPGIPEAPVDDKNEVKPLAENSTSEQPVQVKEIQHVTEDTAAQAETSVAVADDKKEQKTKDTASTTGKQPEQAVMAEPVPLTDTTRVVVKKDSLPALHDLAGEGIFYELGGAWLYGWNGAGKRDARGFSPVAGINYMNQLSGRFAFSFGLGYLRVDGLSNSSKTSRVSTYAYGEQSKVTVITPTTVHYLVAPLRLHYYMDKKNIFGAGANLAYLLNIDATVTTYDERPGITENYSTIKQSGYTKGFSWFDSQLALFYRRNLAPALALQAELFLGLRDVKQNEFFKLNATERNSGAKLSLVYYAFRKTNKR